MPVSNHVVQKQPNTTTSKDAAIRQISLLSHSTLTVQDLSKVRNLSAPKEDPQLYPLLR
jgi:hypothetical protein